MNKKVYQVLFLMNTDFHKPASNKVPSSFRRTGRKVLIFEKRVNYQFLSLVKMYFTLTRKKLKYFIVTIFDFLCECVNDNDVNF